MKLPEFSELPVWRKLAIVLGFAFCISIGFLGAYKDFMIYSSAPDHPVPEAGEIYKIEVMHGSLRYVTLDEKETPLLDKAESWTGAAFVSGFFLWITSPRKSA